MKKKATRLISIFLIMIFAFGSINVYANPTVDSSQLAEVSNAVNYLSTAYGIRNDLQVSSIEPLKSISRDEYDYLLVNFNMGGYAVVYRITGNVVEANLTGENPYNNCTDDKYYAGPLNYLYKQSGTYYDIINDKSILPQQLEDAACEIEKSETSDKAKANSKTINRNSTNGGIGTITKKVSNASYISTMPFGNNTSGTCGSVAAGMMLTYCDKYWNSSIVPSSISYGENLHQSLIPYCEMSIGGSTCQSISDGISDFFNNNGAFLVATPHYMYGVHDSYIKSQINSNRTCVVALSAILGSSTFGDHMVMAYGYGPNSYLVHAGWQGYSSFIINSSYTVGLTYLT